MHTQLALDSTTLAAPYIKAAVRDLKAFRDKRGYRPIPLAYVTTDMQAVRKASAEYLACGDESSAIDLFGMNVYSWCGRSNYYTAAFDQLYDDFAAYSLPLAFAETGCNGDGDRDFAEVAAMLGSVFQALFSGSVVYEWANETNGYGIVQYADVDRPTGFPTTLDDYNALSTVFASANPTGTPRPSYTPSNSAPACPSSASGTWLVDPGAALPTISDLDIDAVTQRTTFIATATDDATTVGTDAVETSSSSSSSSSSSGNEVDTAEAVSQGISIGGIVGIAVAGVAAVIFAALAAFVMIRKKKRLQQQQQGQGQGQGQMDPNSGFGDGAGDNVVKQELPAESVGYVMPRQELAAEQQQQQHLHNPQQQYKYSDSDSSGANHYYEMEGTPMPMSELPAGRER